MGRGRGQRRGRGRGGKKSGPSSTQLDSEPLEGDTTLASQKRRRLWDDTTVTEPASDDGEGTIQGHPDVSSSGQEREATSECEPHQYALRNPGRHPAREAGLVPRPMVEIKADAAAKRAQVKAVQDAKAAEAIAEAAKLSVKKDKFAAMLNEAARLEAEEGLYFDTSPANGDDAEEDEDMYYEGGTDTQGQTKRGAGQGSSAPEEALGPPDAGPFSTASTTSSRSSSNKRKSAGDSGPEERADHAPRKPTAAEKRAQHQLNVIGDLSQRRQLIAPSTPSQTPAQAVRSTSTQDIARKTSTPESSDSAFRPGWRRSLQERARSVAPTPARPRTPATPTSLTPAASGKGKTLSAQSGHMGGPSLSARRAPAEDDDPSFEGLGGLNDDDVYAERTSTLTHVEARKHKGKENGFIISRVSENAERKKKKAVKDARTKRQTGKRAAREPESDEDSSGDEDSDGGGKSLKYDALPSWTRPEIKTQIVPSIFEYLGAQDDPWKNNTTQYTFLKLVQRYIDEVFPQQRYTLRKKDAIYRWCRQQAYEWRRGFEKAANSSVSHALELRRANTELTQDERADHGLHRWVCEAIRPGGEAMFGRPNIVQPGEAKDLLQSPYVLRVVAYHFKSIVGTVNEDTDSLVPKGAIALAATAVERAFRWHAEYQPKGLRRPKFNQLHASALTGEWRETGVQDLLDRPKRLDSLLDRAMELVPDNALRTADATTQGQGSFGPRRSLYQRERSSSPAEPFGAENM